MKWHLYFSEEMSLLISDLFSEMEISNFTKYFVYWKISLVMLLENIITSDVIGKYIMGRLTNIGKYSSWSLILEASLHKIYC